MVILNEIQFVIAVSFWLFLGCSLAIIAVLGGREGRQLVFAILTAVSATFLANRYFGMRDAQYFVVLTDVALLICVVIIALRTSRHWPLWFAGFHLITVSAGIARLVSPSGLPEMYIDAAGFWALPALGAAVVGILLDHRAGLERELD